MLIQALNDYYDILAKACNVLPDGYSKVKVHYKVCLTASGQIDCFIKYQETIEVPSGKGQIKQKWVPREAIMPKRTEKSGIEANIIEHRPQYLFGLNYIEGVFTAEDRTDKAKKSHEALVKSNLKFLEELDTPIINAYRAFLQNWEPEAERDNEKLLDLGKNYDKSGYVFCLSGRPDELLHEDPLLKEKWERWEVTKKQEATGQEYTAQCAISGNIEPIARTHSKIKGVYGGLATGSVLIGYNNPSECSYGLEQAYNSNISERVMNKYTEALNYLLGSRKHKILLDDMTVLFWAMNDKENSEDLVNVMIFGEDQDTLFAEQTEQMLRTLLAESHQGKLTEKDFASFEDIDPDVDFYMVGLKPNSSRLALKFIYRRKFGEILHHIARYQREIHITENTRSIPLYAIKRELLSPKSKNESVNPALIAKLIESILYGTPYPTALLETVLRRIKTDTDSKMSPIRAGIIKACINRNYAKKEEITMALNMENDNQAYLCGRLFAVLEKLQQEAMGNVNRTIKDAYFASAASTPELVFPKLIKLAQNHINKVKRPVFFSRLIGEIMEKLQDEFPPGTLSLQDQGRFDIGYYQQYQSFFEKTNREEEQVEREDN